MASDAMIGIEDIKAAQKRISGAVRTTPMVPSEALTKLCGAAIHLKLEHEQLTGSFKIRGATNAVLNLSKDECARGVVGVSTGNHGRGLAYAAKNNGVNCIICMSELVPQNKVDCIKAQGAEVRIVGRSQDNAQVEVDRLVAEEGMTLIPPFDHQDVIAGQGTLGLELLEQLDDVDTAIIQVSGGGLIGGVALALKSLKPDVTIIGVSMERGAAMHASLKEGKPVPVPELATLADSLGGGIGLDNQYTFALAKQLIDDIVLVSETAIARAIRHAYWEERQLIEGSGSVGIAALMEGLVNPKGNTVCLLSGGNIDMKLHHRIISGEDVNIEEES